MIQPFLLSLLLASSTPDTMVVPMAEIVVSGSRVRESLLRTPAAVSVVTRSQFANGRAIGLDDVLNGVPGVLVQSRGGAQDVRITIRGYGARGNGERSNAGSMRGIRVLSDGIPLSEPDGRTSLDLADVGAADRVEISRSNVSALYGNASGGVVNLRTNLEFDKSYVRLDESGGSFGLRRDQVTYGFTAGRGRGVLSGSNTSYDGWRAHSGSHSAQAHVRFAARVSRPCARLCRRQERRHWVSAFRCCSLRRLLQEPGTFGRVIVTAVPLHCGVTAPLAAARVPSPPQRRIAALPECRPP